MAAGEHASFLCGRRLAKDHMILRSQVFAEEWKCDRGRPIRTVEGMEQAFDRASKRTRKA